MGQGQHQGLRPTVGILAAVKALAVGMSFYGYRTAPEHIHGSRGQGGELVRQDAGTEIWGLVLGKPSSIGQ